MSTIRPIDKMTLCIILQQFERVAMQLIRCEHQRVAKFNFNAMYDLRVIVVAVVIPSLIFRHALLKLFTNFIATFNTSLFLPDEGDHSIIETYNFNAVCSRTDKQLDNNKLTAKL